MWTFTRADGGRGLGFTGGHTHAHWGDVNQRRILLNGLLWLAKVDVPAKGVVDNITAEDLTQNLDPKGAARRPAVAAQRQRKSFSDRPKQTTSHAPSVASCGASCARLAPCSISARSASMSAVSGSALMSGWTIVREALRREEHARQDPHRHLQQVHQVRDRFDRPRAASR